MKTLIYTLTLFVFLTMPACTKPSAEPAGQEGANWLTDYEAALAEAKTSGKTLLMDFTGSDWCGWCIKLDNEVFSRQAFVDYADENLVLLKLDFPKQKEIPEEIKEQNEALASRFRIQAFPTILLVSSDGELIAKTGYKRGGAEAYVTHLKGLTAKKDSAE